jgi:hypothetical protein
VVRPSMLGAQESDEEAAAAGQEAVRDFAQRSATFRIRHVSQGASLARSMTMLVPRCAVSRSVGRSVGQSLEPARVPRGGQSVSRSVGWSVSRDDGRPAALSMALPGVLLGLVTLPTDRLPDCLIWSPDRACWRWLNPNHKP